MERDRWGGPSVMLWGAISWGRRIPPVIFQNNGEGRGRGVTARRYIDEVLQPVVVPFMAGRRHLIFQQDNAKPHTARLTQDFLVQNNIHIIDWPAMSPDLNPIEHLWDEIERRIHHRHVLPATLQELSDAVTYEFDNIPRAFIRNLFLSMRRLCAAVINNNGGHTHY